MSRTLRQRVTRRLAKWRWNRAEHDNRITGRIYRLISRRHPWYDWGNRVMILVGSASGGNYDSPNPPTWWYRQGPPVTMRRTGYPRHPLRTFDVVKGDYTEFKRRYDGLRPDDQYAWRAMSISQDGDLILGRGYWGEEFYGLNRWEVALLRKYLRMWHRRNWFGLRSWLYSHALHAAVHQRKPFACHAVPPRNAGGYSHWHCQLKRSHVRKGELHRFNAYVWGEIDSEPIFVHLPVP